MPGDDVTQDQAFAHANDVLKNAVGGISDIIHTHGLVHVDFEDVKTVMSEPGKAMMGTAQAGGPDRATKVAEAAVACPLLEGIDLSGARGVLVLIAANKNNFKLSESKAAMNTIRRYAAEDAHVIFGAAYDESLGDQLRVTVIATGLSRARPQAAPLTVVQPTAQTGLRTGTDNLPILNSVLATPDHGQLQQSRQPEDGTLSTPSVWSTNRHHASAGPAVAGQGPLRGAWLLAAGDGARWRRAHLMPSNHTTLSSPRPTAAASSWAGSGAKRSTSTAQGM